MNHIEPRQKMKRSNIWIINLVICLMCAIFGVGNIYGQNKEETKKKIQEIKLNEDFIYGEAASDDKELAYGDALQDLLIFANELKNMNSQPEIKINDLITNVETIIYEDGSRYEVLVYIPFKIVIETNRQSSSAKDEIKKMEEQKEAKAFEQSIEKNIEPTVVKNEVQENKTETTSPAPQPVIAVNSEKAAEHETKEIKEAPVPTITLVQVEETVEETADDTEVEEFLITQENFSEIKSYLSDMKRTGKIKETGAVEGNSSLPQDACLILIDEYGGLMAILSPASAGGRTNYKNKKSDSEKNYNSKFIVWYRK